jgi:thioredoxin reductase
MNEDDVLVVGGGAAGLSAALVLLRARRTVVVVDAGRPRNAPAAHMHGFLSRDGMPPADLLAAGRAEVSSYGGRLIDDTVVGVEPGFQVRLASAAPVRARRILVATGLRDELPDVPGVRERWGRDLLHCPYCHGYEVRDQPLGVLGGSPEAVQHALLVRQWSPDVILFPHTDAVGQSSASCWPPAAFGSSRAPSSGSSSATTGCGASNWAAPSSLARRCSYARASSRTRTCSPAWGARWMRTAGWSTIRWGAPLSQRP